MAASAADRSPARLAALGARVIEAEPFFVGPRLLRAGEAVIQARRYIVAAGSAPALPAIAGLEERPSSPRTRSWTWTPRPAG